MKSETPQDFWSQVLPPQNKNTLKKNQKNNRIKNQKNKIPRLKLMASTESGQINIAAFSINHKIVGWRMMLSGLHRNECIIGSLLHPKSDQLKKNLCNKVALPPPQLTPFL